MGKYVIVVQSGAKPGQDDAYNEWYDTTHARQVCEIPGVKSYRRFTATQANAGPPGSKYLAIYEAETDDPMSILAEMGARSSDGRMTPSDALDPASAVLWIYEQND